MNFFFLFSLVWSVKEQNRIFSRPSSPLFGRRRKNRREQKKDRREQNFTLWKKGKIRFSSLCPRKREFCLKPLRKGEKANKNTKDLHHLKSRTSFVVFVALWILLLLLLSNTTHRRETREREYLQHALLIAFFKVAETKVYLSSLL